MDPSELWPVFVATWLVLSGISIWVFFYAKDVAVKRKVHRWLTYTVGVMFTIFALLLSPGLETAIFIVPAVVVIIYLNRRMTRFCDRCAALVYDGNPFSRTKYCDKCGARLLD